MLNVELRIMKIWKRVFEILKLVPDLGVLSLVTEVWKLLYSFTLLVKAGMMRIFVEVTILGILIKWPVLKVTIFVNVADAFFRRGRISESNSY